MIDTKSNGTKADGVTPKAVVCQTTYGTLLYCTNYVTHMSN